MMMSIRKLTNCIHNTPPRSPAGSFKKLSSINQLLPSSIGYQPLSRFQKLRSTGLVFPKSTADKIVFISNMQGNGFRNQTAFQLPIEIPVQKMKDQIDKVCYQKWKDYKEFLQSNAFADSEKAIKILLIVGLTIICFLFLVTLGNLNIVSLIDSLLLISALIVISCMATAIVIFNKDNPVYDYDTDIINSLKNKLAELNQEQKDRTQNEARFRWSCNKDCTWVAIQLFRFQQQFR